MKAVRLAERIAAIRAKGLEGISRDFAQRMENLTF